jgi:hypothetical protein
VHIPSDGQPLPGYTLALADVERRGNEPSGRSLEAARDAGIVTASVERTSGKSKRSFLARLVSGDLDEDEASEQPAPKSTNLRARAPVAVASLSPGKIAAKPVTTETIVPLPAVRPKAVAVANVQTMAQNTAQAKPAEPEATTFDNRAVWSGGVESGDLPPLTPAIAAKPPFALASSEPTTTGSAGDRALGYAADQAAALRPARARPMGSNIPRLPATASVMPAASNSTVVVKSAFAPNLTSGGQRSDSPWLRAAMLTPSVSGFMTATRQGALDMRPLVALLHKPPQALVTTFSADPHLGLVADRFSGRAVVFLATATFTTQTTAALR